MTDSQQIEQRIKRIIADKTKLDEADLHAGLNLEESGLDSFARIELILVIEEEFDIELSDSESANVATIADIVTLIAAKVGT
ncbi:MAG: acyl carrier protein [Gammaproteobacteria bacterium]|nr:acyl carrier protein [Gammaproteobacteria bacterium]